MVWFHGGAFLFGSGNTSFYGPDYLIEKDVVVVTINYRLGALGFLSLNTPEVPGNAGLKDIVQALRWIKQNIHNFGGNAENITVFGESAGGYISSLVAACPLTKDLISKTIIQSGTALGDWGMQRDPVKSVRMLAKELGCSSNDICEIHDFLITTPVKDLVEANSRLCPIEKLTESDTIRFTAVIEQEFPGVEAVITKPYIDVIQSGKVAKIPIMIGSTTLECIGGQSEDVMRYVPKDLVLGEDAAHVENKLREVYFKSGPSSETTRESSEFLADVYFNKDIHRLIKSLVQVSDQPVYFYKFDYIGELNISNKMPNALGIKYAGHMDELGYLFRMDMLADIEPTPQDLTMRERIVRLWTNFAKYGNPTPEDNYYLAVNWLPVSKENMHYLNLSNELTLASNIDRERMELWDELYDKYYNPQIITKTSEHFIENCEAEKEETDSAPVIVQETLIKSVVNDELDNRQVDLETAETNMADVEKKIDEIQDTMDKAAISNVLNGKEEIDTKPIIVQETVIQSVVNDQPVENVVVVQSSATNLADFEKKVEEIQQAMDDALAHNNGTESVVVVEKKVTEIVQGEQISSTQLIESSEHEEIRSVREIMTVYTNTNSEVHQQLKENALTKTNGTDIGIKERDREIVNKNQENISKFVDNSEEAEFRSVREIMTVYKESNSEVQQKTNKSFVQSNETKNVANVNDKNTEIANDKEKSLSKLIDNEEIPEFPSVREIMTVYKESNQQKTNNSFVQTNGMKNVGIISDKNTENVTEKGNSVSKIIENEEIAEFPSVREIMTVYKEGRSENDVDHHKLNGKIEKKPRPSNEIKMVVGNNVNPKDVIRANDPPEDDLPKNIGVNKFVNFFESLGKK